MAPTLFSAQRVNLTPCAFALLSQVLRAELARAHDASAALAAALSSARAAEEALRREEAALRGRLASAHADNIILRLEVSRLRGAVPRADAGGDDGSISSAAASSAALPSPRRRGSSGAGAFSSASAEASASSAARVQAAVQAQLRALRYEDVQRAACPVCMRDDRRKDTALGCGHVFCAACAAALQTCALCRAPIALRVHLY